MRRAGVLLHVSSLPGPGPVGTIGAPARRFVDFLQQAGQTVWQVLPLTPPADVNSPYSAYSVFAGNPYLIDLEELELSGWLPAGSVASLPGRGTEQVDYGDCARHILPLLRTAFEEAGPLLADEISLFRQEHAFWLEDYALYMSIRTKQGDISYHDWPPLLCIQEQRELEKARRELKEQVDFWVFVQYLFFSQWSALKWYANNKGISILGDMPIYTAPGSADVWSHSKVFLVNNRHKPSFVAGVPPDGFSADGQRWGNPLYNWDHLKETGYEWWIQRLRVAAMLYDEIRIDHFRGLDEFYAIPAHEPTARGGNWQKGPGMDFFRAVKAALPELKLIAEDLGVRTPGVEQLLADSGLPGMSVLLFAFDPLAQSAYLPHNHQRHQVAYIGTHDNDTAFGWIKDGDPEQVLFAARYLRLGTREGYHWGLIRGLYGSVADTAIVQMQDFLGLDNTARMNTPSTVGPQNWSWRLGEDALTDRLAAKIGALTARYGRIKIN